MSVRYFPNPPESIDQNSADAVGWRREVAHELNIDTHIEKTVPLAVDEILIFSVADNNTRKSTLAECIGSGTGIGGVLSVSETLSKDDTETISGVPITTTGTIARTGADAGSDKIVFWDDSADKKTYLTIGSGLSITGTTLNADAGIYIVSGTFSGVPTDNQYITVHPMSIATSFASGLANSCFFAETAATGSTAFDIRKRLVGSTEASIGTMTVAAGATVATFTFSSTTAFAIGDSLVIKCGTADATLADFGWSIRGTR